jgi:hypothetical protein
VSRGPLLLAAALLAQPAAASEDPEPEAPTPIEFGVPGGGEVYLSAGLLLSGSKRPEGLVPGLGAEVSVHRFLEANPHWGLGLLGQWQWMGFDSHRFAGGLQGTYRAFGLELGVAHQTASEARAATTGLHVAPFFTYAGMLTVSVRVGLPLHHDAASGRPGHGYDVGLGLAVKLPLLLHEG